MDEDVLEISLFGLFGGVKTTLIPPRLEIQIRRVSSESP
jgi:hypothetical protein